MPHTIAVPVFPSARSSFKLMHLKAYASPIESYPAEAVIFSCSFGGILLWLLVLIINLPGYGDIFQARDCGVHSSGVVA